MVSKAQPAIGRLPVQLETIIEESGDSLTTSTSATDSHNYYHHHHHHHQKSSSFILKQPIHGLISARSIPSVDIHRKKRINDYQERPPVEVRYRDGTKHYIHSALGTMSVSVNKKKYSYNSRHDSSLSKTKISPKYRQTFNTTPKKKKILPKKSDILLTIITAEQLSQADITPPSTSSPDDSDTRGLIKSQSNSSLDATSTFKDISLKDTDEERLTSTTNHLVTQTLIDTSMSTTKYPTLPEHHLQYQPSIKPSQQIPFVCNQSISESHMFIKPTIQQQKPMPNSIVSVNTIPKNTKTFQPSLQITLPKDDSNKPSISFDIKQIKSTTNSTCVSKNEMNISQFKQALRPPKATLLGSGSRSAFRPFSKNKSNNDQKQTMQNGNTLLTYSDTLKSTTNSRSHIPKYQQMPLSNVTRVTVQQTSKPTNQVAINQRLFASDVSTQTQTSTTSNLLLSDIHRIPNPQIKSSNYSQETTIKSKVTNNDKRHTNLNQPIQTDGANLINLNTNLHWHSVASNSLYDVPRLATKYCDIPLHITLPDGTPTHNQKLVHKHDIELEKRLSDAGLSPETIALYERILEVADMDPSTIVSPPEIIDQYQYQSLL